MTLVVFYRQYTHAIFEVMDHWWYHRLFMEDEYVSYATQALRAHEIQQLKSKDSV